jgi:glycosyltransferase involved in cell wall biosynthesis
VKIAIVHNSYQQPGGEDFVFEQECRLLEEKGHKVIRYLRSNWEVESYSGWKRLSLAQRTIWSGETRKDFAQLLEREKPDLVHIHNTFVVISPSIYSACRDADVPVVQTLHNYRLLCPAATFFREGKVCEECVDHGLFRGVMHACYRDSVSATATTALMLKVHRYKKTWTEGVRSFISLTQFSRSRFVRAGLAPEKVFVKPNFVHPDPGVGERGGDYAVFVGRLSPEKRVSTMLNAWTLLKARSTDIPLLVIGGGPERVHLEAEARQRNLTSVVFKGLMPRSETIKLIGDARFLVFSSEWYENFPLTIVESFARGVPVICSRLGAMEEIVDDGRNGIHFTAGDPEDLAAKVGWAWNHVTQMRAIGQAARREYESKYTADRNYEQLMEIYEHTLQKRGEGNSGSARDSRKATTVGEFQTPSSAFSTTEKS